MKKMMMRMTSVAVLLTSGLAFGAVEKDDSGRELKVLMIGNSFSICCLHETPAIAESMGLKLDLASLYIGGCSLERHWNNATNTAASFKPYRFDRTTGGSTAVEKKSINIPEALTLAKWDVVTVQQASHFSWNPETYHPWGDDLVALVRRLAPQAKVVVQETWSYPPWDARLKEFGFDQVDMYAKLHDAYADFAKKHGCDVIPTGTAAEFAPDRNALFTRPDFHFNGQGVYLQGLVWTAKLFGVDVTKCAYRPEWMDAARADELKAVAQKAVDGRLASGRVFRDARVTRGNTNILKLQPIDRANWIWIPGDAGVAARGDGKMKDHPSGGVPTDPVFLKFRKAFDVEEGDGTLVLDVSADERYYLTLDGEFVGRGPNRSTVENWQYNTYVFNPKPGKHVLEAVVWKTNDKGPFAQLSWRGGFIVKAGGKYDAKLTTDGETWQVGRLDGIEPAGIEGGVFGVGIQWKITGAGMIDAEPAEWVPAECVRGWAGADGPKIWGGRTDGWMLFPSQIPDQTEDDVGLPGRCAAISFSAEWRKHHVYTGAEANVMIDTSLPVTIPAHMKIQVAWDLGRYICAYPVVTLKGGKGAKFAVAWAEATQRGSDNLKGCEPNARNLIVGRYLDGFGDTFVSDGRDRAVFTPPWFRCGKWLRIDIETGDEPLTVESARLIESRYPVEMESAFSSPQDPSLADIRRIAARAMQMCCHEMLFDCPFYEQQMYPGDTRVQLNVLSALSRDDRIIKRAIELYDLSTRDDGMCPFNWPTRGTQEGASYTLCYLLMYGDYAMNHADTDWLKARLPGMRKSMAGMEYYENGKGLLENLPGWNFMDWVVGWDFDGTAPGCRTGEGVNAELNLYWVLAMRSAAATERALGHELQAQYWEAKIEKVKPALMEAFWDEERGLFADTPARKDFSEHAQCLALLGDVLPAAESAALFEKLVTEPDLKRCTVYFSYYLFDCYFKFGRGDLFLKRLDLWRTYVAKGLTTTQEAPDSGKNNQCESRSDCHAWGAHPIWFMQTGLAGIKSDAPCFAKVRIAPCPGTLTEIHAKHPHPNGWITVDLTFKDGKASGEIRTPVDGTFVFGGETRKLKAGLNTL